MAQARLGETPFAVVDLETTGLHAGGHDRVVEVGAVRFSPAFEVLGELNTLVNPRRDLGRSDIHGISGAELVAAPEFEEIGGDLAALLCDAIVVGHHLRFDLDFLRAEYGRAGCELPALPGLCTLRLAYELADVPSRSLGRCCLEAGIRNPAEHMAIEDARATGYLLCAYLGRARDRGLADLRRLGCEVLDLPRLGWGALPPTGRALCRQAARTGVIERRSFLGRLVARMPGTDARSPRENEYLALLDRVLEDRVITQEEASALIGSAETWGLDRTTLMEVHRRYLGNLVSAALADRQLSPAERQDLVAVCDMLGLHGSVLDALIAECEQGTVPPRRQAACVESLRGQSVCFTGELLACYRGERVSRELAERLAAEAGLEVRSSVTKTLDILVVADPDSQSGKAKKARAYGVRILADRAFWPKLGIDVD